MSLLLCAVRTNDYTELDWFKKNKYLFQVIDIYIDIFSVWFYLPESGPLLINMLISVTRIHPACGYPQGPWTNPYQHITSEQINMAGPSSVYLSCLNEIWI